MTTKRLTFFGAGKMAFALARALLANGMAPGQLCFFDPVVSQYDKLREFGVRFAQNEQEAMEFCDLFILAVTPQNMAGLCELLRTFDLSGKYAVSIAAGVTTRFLDGALGMGGRIVRVMPNAPLLVSEAATAVSPAYGVPQEILAEVVELFSCAGLVRILDEEDMNRIIFVNGSSPAFLFYYVKVLCDCAREQGLDPQTAQELLVQSFKGSLKMISESGKTLDELITMISTRGGTTVAALDRMRDSDWEDILHRAMQACTDRAEELSH